MGDTTTGTPREIRFSGDVTRRHHLYVARTRMGKSTLMHHVAVHKMMEKAQGRDSDAIVVVDPHADLVEGLLEHVPECADATLHFVFGHPAHSAPNQDRDLPTTRSRPYRRSDGVVPRMSPRWA